MTNDKVPAEELAAVFRQVRRSRFADKKNAAYAAAGVNSATWNRLEGGLSVKPHILAKAIRKLWPETDGDWRTLLKRDSVGGRTHTGDHVRLTGEEADSGVSNADLLREIVAMRQALERLAGGQPGAEPVDGAGGPT